MAEPFDAQIDRTRFMIFDFMLKRTVCLLFQYVNCNIQFIPYIRGGIGTIVAFLLSHKRKWNHGMGNQRYQTGVVFSPTQYVAA